MKKKLLYGLVGLVFALSLAGFAACSDGDSGGHGGGSDNDDDEVTTVKKTVNEDKTITAEISWAADSAVEIIPKSELEDAKTVTIHVDEAEGMSWNTMCSASDWSNQVPGFFSSQSSWETEDDENWYLVFEEDNSFEISAATIITYQTYLDNGVYLGGPEGASLTITYTVGYTAPDDPYTITLGKSLSTSPVQILTADDVESYGEVQIVFNQTSTDGDELYLCTDTDDVVATFGSTSDPYVYFTIYEDGIETNFGYGWDDSVILSDFEDGGLYLYTNTSGATYSIGVKSSE